MLRVNKYLDEGSFETVVVGGKTLLGAGLSYWSCLRWLRDSGGPDWLTPGRTGCVSLSWSWLVFSLLYFRRGFWTGASQAQTTAAFLMVRLAGANTSLSHFKVINTRHVPPRLHQKWCSTKSQTPHPPLGSPRNNPITLLSPHRDMFTEKLIFAFLKLNLKNEDFTFFLELKVIHK